MPPKKKTPAPIDRPLSRAYLREFTGWSTAYPPGISDPTSLRIMENVMINRDSSVRIRPGLRHISFQEVDGVLGGIRNKLVGSHEPFFLNDKSKAYLFAVREDDGKVGFRVLARSPAGQVVKKLTDDGIDFRIHGDLNFSSGTTYVKYLQIDNKIYALSNNGEMMRQFLVGDNKEARRLTSISRPEWSIADKLTVVQPKASWIDGGRVLSTVTNHLTAPNMSNIADWDPLGSLTTIARTTAIAYQGAYSLRLTSKPERTNLMPQPLNNPGTTGKGDWFDAGQASTLDVFSNDLRINVKAGHKDDNVWAGSPKMAADEKTWYRCAFDLQARSDVDTVRVQFNFYTTGNKLIGEPQTVNCSETVGDRKYPADVRAPAGTDSMRIYIGGKALNNTSGWMRFKNVLVCKKEESGAMFHGGSGTNYFWTGAANNSASVYHPPATVQVVSEVRGLKDAKDYVASGHFRSESVARGGSLDIEWFRSDDTLISSKVGAPINDASGVWTRNQTTEKSPANTDHARVRIKIAAVPRGEYHCIDGGQFEEGTQPSAYFDGDSPNTPTEKYSWLGTAGDSKSVKETYAAVSVLPPAETKTADTLISSDKTKNKYSFGFFYTFTNEVGESSASQATIIKMQRAWGFWDWKDGSGNDTQDSSLSVDQLAVFMPQPAHEAAWKSGAEYWNLYGFTWSDQNPVPVDAVLITRKKMTPDHSETGWAKVTADMASYAKGQAIIPSEATRHNFSDPSKGGQGIVAADRMVMVYDPAHASEIRWTSNEQGNYTDFSASRGGGYKNLTSGNLYIPACVMLWQNPQSVDTLTILCLGTDGRSAGYYMAPAEISAQSDSTQIMGFEETTATPGTTSPYGCEVMNNALYHPLDDQLMKSTANNYNINHKPQTDQIADVWRGLLSKQYMVSSQLNNRIYYLVNNPDGDTLQSDCRGNEVWVLDAQAETPTWSRWRVQGCSLRKIEQGTKIFMSVVRPEGLFYFDEDYDRDDVVDPVTYEISQKFIDWKLETNTQGANRAHDAWAHLQQANIVAGFFQGNMRYGVRGWDSNGKPVDVSKTFRDMNEASSLAFDIEGYLLVRRDMKEWFFYAESLKNDDGSTQQSFGQINLVQYRYAPVSVNLGYEFGSIETFEYQRSFQPLENRTTTNGVPIPYVDTRRP